MVKHSGALAPRQNGPRPLGTARKIAARAGWQPIETAPRDATRVLIWVDKLYAVAFYDEGDWWDEDGNLYVVAPECWQPLPAPPKPLDTRGRFVLSCG